jgi:hypothetical protein
MDYAVKCPSCGAKLALEPMEEAEHEHAQMSESSDERERERERFRPRKRGRHVKGMSYSIEEEKE